MRLPQKGRPTEVVVWAGSPEDPNVHILDTTAFGAAWIAWWIDCQPPARSSSSWPLPQIELQHSDWGKMLYGGRNGIFMFVMAMSWWANRIDPTQPPPDFSSALADLRWVLEQLNECFAPPPTPVVPPTSPPKSSLGKRTVRLSERASDAPERLRKMFNR